MEFTRSRRVLAGAAFAAAATMGLAACSSGSSDPASSGADGGSGEQVEIRLNWWGSDARHERTQEAIDAFMAEYPNITVVGEFSDWTGYWDKLATSTAGSNMPDVIQMDQLYLASYAERGTLADLGALSTLDTSNLSDSVLGIGQVDGTQYAMPVSTVGFTILVNQDILDELGLTLPDTDSWTWDDFYAFAAEVTEVSGGDVVGTAPMNNEFSLQLWARQNGEALFTDGNVSISPEVLADYLAQGLEMSKIGASAEATAYSEQASLPLDQIDFSVGKQAMAFTQITQIAAYTAASDGANLVAVKLPTEDANASKYLYLKPGMYFSVSSQSEHPEEAAQLIDFLVNDPTAAEIIGTERGLPANPNTIELLADSLTPEETKAVEYTDSIADLLGEAPEIVPNGASGVDGLIQRYILEVYFESSSPIDAADAFISELQSSIDAA
ncbi:ABC transporter substrate-binding protein [Demequina lignilytica]|uniref:Extracellular solute-binding protein n=1 Tax=Demequina lignilytica TaxID=3051663 RepID=A0AB35MES6_9MICO|nr:extracellular solute-binding protein [Demequina sp. SYSU T0a273]MDN4482274.1 extracellular solute-binding protein [Demequina sp. SYSU T0a273]